MDDLKPCPFCGQSDVCVEIATGHAECGTCGATGPWSSHGESFLAAELRHYWNLRPIEDALRAEIAELRGLMAAMIDAATLPGHVITDDEWTRACLLSGRFCEPQLSSRPDITSIKAELARYTSPLTEEMRRGLYSNLDFCLAIDTDNIEMIDAAIRQVRAGRAGGGENE